MFYDTHAHINADNYKDNLTEIINGARENKVNYINVVGFDPKTNALANEIALKYDNLYATCGLHPSDIHLHTEDNLKQLEFYLKQEITVAVGECGLDYYWHKETRDKQIDYFKKQIELSKKYQKPLIIHVRDALSDSYEVLKEASKDGLLKGVMHCFSGSSEMAKQFLDLGLYISLGGPVTFKNAKAPKEVAKIVPLDRLLIETDCPYLAPHPYRGKQNKPAYVTLIADEIAKIKEVSIEEIASATTQNAKRLFNIK
ncbi:TatD family hydrolase [Mycoplasmatota bacterium]|nr:TatD family hydrolase [Mycoplasmatota bacterium]